MDKHLSHHPGPLGTPRPTQGPQPTASLFSHPWVERLSRTHISVPVVLFYGAALAALGWALMKGVAPLPALGLFVGGLLAFTLWEYSIHRWLFHLKGHDEFQYTVHGVHHAHPKDKDRLAMPPLLSGAIVALLYWIFVSIGGSQGGAFFAGFVAGYASYLLVHYCVHAMRPPKHALRILWKHHHLHHHKNTNGYFGVSSPLWDVVFGTNK